MAETTMGPDGGKQKLSAQARRDKQARDKAYAMTEDRKKKKRENQTFVDADGNKGQRSDSDIHHTKSGTQKRTSIAYNRATHDRDEVKT
mgnify:CR=1 FL=1|tara:strand:- start:846 stop:1112 length:267 start_codon:yes stop_codon:yes gene_type:complete